MPHSLREIKISEIKDLQRLGHKCLIKDGKAYTTAPLGVVPKREEPLKAQIAALEARIAALENRGGQP